MWEAGEGENVSIYFPQMGIREKFTSGLFLPFSPESAIPIQEPAVGFPVMPSLLHLSQITIIMKICLLPLITVFLLLVSCAVPQQRLSGRTDIPLLFPGAKYASWKINDASFDEYRYYMISKYKDDGKSITIIASNEDDEVASPTDKKVMIPEIGMVRYRRRSVGGDEEPARFQTDPFSRDDGRGGKVFYIVRVTTDDGDQEVMLKSVKWAVPGSSYL